LFARRSAIAIAIALSSVACEDKQGSDNQGISIFGIDTGNNLLRFGSMSPQNVTLNVAITGLQTGETVLGIDFRPANALLYALGSTSRLYVVDTTTAVATAVGFSAVGPFATLLSGASFGFDFNPTVDRLRVLSDLEQNLRLHPDNGNIAVIDTALTFAFGDPYYGNDPGIVATAYTNSFVGASSTTLYAIDANREALVVLQAPNSGRMTRVGTLGTLDVNGATGFDIHGKTGVAYATLTASGKSKLYTINLSSVTATFVGDIGSSLPVHGIAAAPQ
jgi:hypothetical protein